MSNIYEEDIIGEIDTLRACNSLDELVDVCKEIVKDKRYLLVENEGNPVLVDIVTANAFNTIISMVSTHQFLKINNFFAKFGPIATIKKITGIYWKCAKR